MRSAATLLVLGDSPTVRLVADLAAGLGFPTVAPGEPATRPVVALVAGTGPTPDEVWAAAPTPAAVFAEPAASPGLVPRFTPATAGGSTGAALLAAWSPLVTRAGREIAAAGPLRHVEVRVRRPQGGALAEALALASWSLAGHDLSTVRATGDTTAALSGDGVTASVAADEAAVPEWSLQAASDTRVVRLELAPTVSLERDGVAVPTGDDPEEDPAVRAARHLGVVGFLDAVRSGDALDPARRPPGAHPAWGARVEQVARALAASRRDGGAPAPLD